MIQRLFALSLILAFFFTGIAAAFNGYWCWTNRNLNGVSTLLKNKAFLWWAISLETLCRLVAAMFGFVGRNPKYTAGFAVSYWIGQTAMAAVTIRFLLFYLRAYAKLGKQP